MKKKAIIIVVIAMLLLGMLACLLCPRVVQLEECSEVYRRYEGLEGIDAAYIKNYRVNDTLTLPVTLLEATTDSGWAKLVSKFNVPMEMVELAKSNPDIDIWVGQALKDRPEVLCDVSELNEEEAQELEIMTISMQMHTICIFHTCNKQEMDAIFYEKIPANI